MRLNMRLSKSVKRGGRQIAIASYVVFCSSAGLAAPQAQNARSLFQSTCASCHGQNGTPTTVGKSLNAPVLSSPAVQTQPDTLLGQIISDGKGNMPSFKGNLAQDQIQSLVAYIRTFSKQHKQASH